MAAKVKTVFSRDRLRRRTPRISKPRPTRPVMKNIVAYAGLKRTFFVRSFVDGKPRDRQAATKFAAAQKKMGRTNPKRGISTCAVTKHPMTPPSVFAA